MSTISASTTSTTAFKVTSDTTGTLVFQTGATPTTALTLGSDQSATFAGSPTFSGGTANGVLYLNGSKAVTSGSALQFDGQTLKISNTSPYLDLNATNRQWWVGGVDTGATDANLQIGTGVAHTNNLLILTPTGNLGLGVTPSAWISTRVGLDIGSYGALVGNNSGGVSILFNSYRSASAYVAKNTGQCSFYDQSGGAHYWYNSSNTSITAGASWTPNIAMTLDASGNLMVGTTSAFGKFKVNVGTNQNLFVTTNNSMTSLGSVNDASSGYTDLELRASQQIFHNGSSERARIDSSGNLLVGKTAIGDSTLGAELQASGTVVSTRSGSTSSQSTMIVYSTGASAYRFYVGMGGVVNATSTTITGISDVRLKENIRDLDDGLEKVMALQPRKFDWKEGKGADIKNARGFIAQEFEQVFPDMIQEWLDPAPEGEEPYKAVNANLIPTLVKAIQELKADLDATKAELAALKG